MIPEGLPPEEYEFARAGALTGEIPAAHGIGFDAVEVEGIRHPSWPSARSGHRRVAC